MQEYHKPLAAEASISASASASASASTSGMDNSNSTSQRAKTPFGDEMLFDRQARLSSSSVASSSYNASPSWWRRVCCCCCSCFGFASSSGPGGPRDESGSISSTTRMHQGRDAQLLADSHLKEQIQYFSTMRVHMKRVQLCLEQDKRNKFYRELLVYFVFLLVVMFTLISLPVHFPYEQKAALQDLYFDEEFPNLQIKKSFYDIMTEDELWQWMNGPLVAGFYDSPLRNSQRIGSIMIRSGKVVGQQCASRHSDKTFGYSSSASYSGFVLFPDAMCFPEFTAEDEDTASFGNASDSILRQQYHWRNDLDNLIRSQTFNPSIWNWRMSYGKGGYVVYLPRDNKNQTKIILKQLKQDFLTDATRYFMVQFVLFNPQSEIFNFVQVLFEMSNTDLMEKSVRLKSFRFFVGFNSTKDQWLMFLRHNWTMVLLFGATCWLLWNELMDLKEFGLSKYLHSMWNILDIIQLILLIVFLECWVSYLIECDEVQRHLIDVAHRDCSQLAHEQEEARQCFVNLQSIAWQFERLTDYASVLALVSVAIVFKYLRLNSRLNLLWRTLRFAAKDLLAFVAIFFTIFFGFAVMGFLAFGNSMRQYHSLSVSLTSCFQMLLGAFDYNLLRDANPTMASLFFFSFMISVYLICVNMFIAIMSEYYSLAQEEKKKHEENKKHLTQMTRRNSAFGPGSSSLARSISEVDFTDSLQFSDDEYDVLMQIKNYIRGLRLQVHFQRDKQSGSSLASQIPLWGDQHVLLIDAKYLAAERKRLRKRWRVWVHFFTICVGMMRSVTREFDIPELHKVMNKQVVMHHSRRSTGRVADEEEESKHAEDDYFSDFPVTYIPISSRAAKVVRLLGYLRRGMHVDVDDGSLTKDQITLEVLGGQEMYVTKETLEERKQQHEALFGDEDAPPSGAVQLQMDNNSDAGASQSRRESKSNKKDLKQWFGLHHNHKGIGKASHIRACRVIYNGETIVEGMETCLLPRRLWVRYFFGHMLWGSIRKCFMCSSSQHRKQKNRLLNEAEIESLITEHFAAPGRGISCRFDELVRNFRMVIAKKAHRKQWRMSNMEEDIMREVISFLERFPSALEPLDKRELEGYKYVPQPVDTTRVRLPNSVNRLLELLSQNAHEVWAVGRIEQGWKWGAKRDNDNKLHPDLIPYEDLTEETKQYDRDTSMSALKVISALGYILEPPESSEDFDIEFGSRAEEEGGTYVPKPIPTDDVKVPHQLKAVIELLAENTHEVWAQMRMAQGWKYGPRRDDHKREHNGLVPYIYLTNDEKQMDRNTAMQTVKLILRCGFTFVPKEKRSNRRRLGGGQRMSTGGSRKGQGVFGRNENPQMGSIPDAAVVAKGTARAKNVFMRRINMFGSRTLSSSSIKTNVSDAASAKDVSESSRLSVSSRGSDDTSVQAIMEKDDDDHSEGKGSTVTKPKAQ